MLTFLTDPLAHTFFTRALIAVLIVGTVAPIIGTFVVLRGTAFLGDALAHIILPGVVGAFLLGIHPMIGALVTGIATALGIGALNRRAALKEDTAIGVIFAGAFALGVAMLSRSERFAVDLTHFLFGNLLGINSTDLWIMALLGVIVILTVGLFFKELLVVSFDPVLATTLRLPTARFNNLLLVLMAVTIVVALNAVGVALMLAMLVTPAAAARLLTRRVPAMMTVGVLIGILSGISGLYLSFYLNIAAGPAVVLAATLLFAIAFLLSPHRKK